MHVPQGDTYHFLFTTRSFSTGAPATLSSGTFAVYEEGTSTPIQTTQALTADYNSNTGLNYLGVVATSGNGYDIGSYYSVVLDAGTVGGVSVDGEVVGHFRVIPPEISAGIPDVNTMYIGDTAQTGNDNGADINILLTRIVGTLASGTHNAQTGDAYAIVNSGTFGNAQLVRSTTPANTLDVSATGEAGVDFSNVNGTLDAAELGADCITAAKIADNAFSNEHFAAGALTSAEITSAAGCAVTSLAAGIIDNTSVGTLDNTNFAFVDGSERVDVGSVLGTAQTAGDLAALITTVDTVVDNLNLGIIYGTTSGTPTTTATDTNLTGYADDELIGRVIIFTGGTADGQASRITDYANTNGVVTYDLITTAPAASDSFKIV
jgi:hypothetical protein